MLYWISCVFLLGLGAWLGMAKTRNPDWVKNPRNLRWVAAGVLLGMAGFTFGVIGKIDECTDGFAAAILFFSYVVVPMGLAGAIWSPFLSEVGASFLVESLPRWWMGDHKIKLIASFDLGDAAMKAGDPAKAVNLYRLELDRHPDEPALYLRLVDAYRVLKDPAQVVANLRHATRCAADAEQKGMLSILLAEELGKSGDPGGAQTVLQAVLRDEALAKFHAAAKGRLQKPFG